MSDHTSALYGRVDFLLLGNELSQTRRPAAPIRSLRLSVDQESGHRVTKSSAHRTKSGHQRPAGSFEAWGSLPGSRGCRQNSATSICISEVLVLLLVVSQEPCSARGVHFRRLGPGHSTPGSPRRECVLPSRSTEECLPL